MFYPCLTSTHCQRPAISLWRNQMEATKSRRGFILVEKIKYWQDSKASRRISRPGLMPSGEQVIQSPRKQTPLQLKRLDACSYLYSRTFKKPSSTPALYQRCEKTPKHYFTIFKHSCICSCSHYYFPVFMLSQLSFTSAESKELLARKYYVMWNRRGFFKD